MMINYQCALKYAAKGWHVFPLQGKVPLKDSKGLLDATTNAKEIKKFFQGTAYNIGIRTGPESNLTVVDIDCHSEVNGFDSFRMVELEHESITTLSVRTPSGGRHLYFQYIEGSGNRAGVLPSVDVRSNGGYVVAPYSTSAEGKAYIWENELEPIQAPKWLAELILKPTPAAPAVNEVGLIPIGQRNSTLFKCICGLRYQGIPQDLAEDFALLFRKKCEGNLPEEEVIQTVKNIYKKYKPFVYSK
jgi:hypothetical protein